MTLTDSEAGAGHRSSSLRLLRGLDWSVLLLILVVVAALLVYPAFDTPRNIENILRNNVPLALVAMAMTFVLIGGQFDLSVGATFGTCGVLFAGLLETMPLLVAFLLALSAGLLMGLVNAFLVTVLRLPSFMATFGTALAILGLGLYYSETQIPITSPAARAFAKPELLGLPADVLVTGLLACLMGVLLWRTPYGRSLYAAGGDVDSARLAGIRVGLISGATFVIAGGASALAGMITVTRTGSGFATMGADIPLAAITVVVVGGTSIWGGRGAIWRTIVGVLIIAVLGNVLSGLSAPTSTQQLVSGVAVVMAIAFQKRRTGERA